MTARRTFSGSLFLIALLLLIFGIANGIGFTIAGVIFAVLAVAAIPDSRSRKLVVGIWGLLVLVFGFYALFVARP
jgi:uncharacterized membrane protein (UPF0136 family)